MRKLDEIPVDEIAVKIRELMNHDGFALLQERFEEELIRLQDEINSEANNGEETQRNKRARARMILASPSVLAEDIFSKAKNKFDKAEKPHRRPSP